MNIYKSFVLMRKILQLNKFSLKIDFTLDASDFSKLWAKNFEYIVVLSPQVYSM